MAYKQKHVVPSKRKPVPLVERTTYKAKKQTAYKHTNRKPRQDDDEVGEFDTFNQKDKSVNERFRESDNPLMNRRYEDDIGYYAKKLGIKSKKSAKAKKTSKTTDEFDFDEFDELVDSENDALSSEEEEEDVDDDEKDQRDIVKASKENPYIPPTVPAATEKYMPPSIRRKQLESSESEQQQRLRRQCQGLINRLSEANIASIVGELLLIYSHNARQTVTEILTRLIIDSTAARTTLLEGFVIVHGALIAALFKHLGADFGAFFLQTLVEDFDKFYLSKERGKECANLMVLLSQLYTFQLVGCGLVYDFIRLFLDQISELHTELLLRLVQSE